MSSPAAAPPAPEQEEEDAEAAAGGDDAGVEERLRGVSLKRPAPESAGDDAAAEGGAKRPAPSAGAADGDAVCFRLLVPARRAGPLLARGGAGVGERDAAGARVRVLEPVAGCEEHVVEISSAAGEGDALPAAQARSRAQPRRGADKTLHRLLSAALGGCQLIARR
jgi:hypothetical protein